MIKKRYSWDTKIKKIKMTSKDLTEKLSYEEMLSKIRDISKRIKLEPSDESIDTKKIIFKLYGKYLENIEKYKNEEQILINNSFNALNQRLTLAKDYIRLNYLKELRENTSLSEKIRDSLKNLGYKKT